MKEPKEISEKEAIRIQGAAQKAKQLLERHNQRLELVKKAIKISSRTKHVIRIAYVGGIFGVNTAINTTIFNKSQ